MPQSTRAIVFAAPNVCELRDISLPEPREDELVVRMSLSGISVGTERWALLGRRPEMRYPFVTGYLGVGVVESVGSAAKGGFAAGDRVFTTNARPGDPYAGNSWLGTHSAHAIVPTGNGGEWPPYLLKIPDSVDDASAAMAGLASVSIQGADMLRGPRAGETALVLGLGLIGQSSVQVLRARGARVVAADLLPLRVDAARTAGCEAAVLLDRDRPLKEQLAAHLPADGADIVVDTTSAPPVLLQLATLVKMRGQILLQGYYPGRTELDLHSLHGRRPTIHVPCSMDAASHAYAHRLIADGALRLGSLITHRTSAEDAPAIYRMILEQPDAFLGIVLSWK